MIADTMLVISVYFKEKKIVWAPGKKTKRLIKGRK